MPLANRTRAGRRDCGGGAPFCAALRAAQCAMRSRKRPCQPKTAKRFFGGPGSHGPSGQAKERTRILPVRRGSFCPAAAPYGGLAVLARLAAVMRAFAPGAPACFPCCSSGGCACALPQIGPRSASLFPARGQSAAFASGLRCLLLLLSLSCAAEACLLVLIRLRGFALSIFAFSCLTSSSQISFHLSLRPRRASTFFRKESRQRFARGRGSAPFEPPFQRPAAVLSFFRAAGRLKRPFGRKPPAGKGNA